MSRPYHGRALTSQDRQRVQLVKVRRLANDTYRGSDPVTRRDVRCHCGQAVEVSEQKARQLMRDFGGDWEYVSPAPDSGNQHAHDYPIAVHMAGQEHTSVRCALGTLLEGLQAIGVEARAIARVSDARPDEVMITWGVGSVGGSGAAHNVILDAIDGWRWDAHAVKMRNRRTHMTLGLSRHSCDAVRGFGVACVAELPLGVDRSKWYPVEGTIPQRFWVGARHWGALDDEPRFWFLSVAAWQERKGLHDLVSAFAEEFGPDERVGLLIKGQHHLGWGRDASRSVEEQLRGRKHAPVVYSGALLSCDEMRQLYCAARCYVSASRLEGWGLPPLEAMACGTPVVLTDATGHQDYATAENAYLVPCTMESMSGCELENGLTAEVARGITWGIPDHAAFRAALRRAANECHTSVPPAMAAAMERTVRWFSPAYSAMRAVQGLRQYGLEPAWRPPELSTQHPRVAVCIPVLNSADLLRATLTSLEATDCAGLRVLVWDDGSSDGTRQVVTGRRWRIPVEVRGTQQHRGLLAARQSLIDWAIKLKPEFICFLDGDMFSREAGGVITPVAKIDPQWLRRLCAMHVDGLSGPKLLTPDGKVWSAGGHIGTGTAIANAWLRGFLREDGAQFSKPDLVDFLPGACLLGRTELWRRLRCDTAYPGSILDDVDLAMQVQRVVGEHCWYQPGVVAVHNAFSLRSRNDPEAVALKKAHRDECRLRFQQKWGCVDRAPKQPSVFVAIPTLNYRDLLLACLRALEQTTGVDMTVGVYDDGSTDGTREALARHMAPYPLIVIGSPERRGLPHARAELMQLGASTGAEFFCFLDADCFSRGNPPEPYMPDPAWLATLCRLHRDGISTAKILTPDGQVWSAGGMTGPGGLPSLRGFHQPDDGRYDEACEVPHVPGALMFMRSTLIRSIEIDKTYDLRGRDDTDICYQVTRTLGEHCWYWPQAVVVHNSWSSRYHTPAELAQHRAEVQRSDQVFRRKWGE